MKPFYRGTMLSIMLFFLFHVNLVAESVGDVDVEAICRINETSYSWRFTNNGEATKKVTYRVLPNGSTRNTWVQPGESKDISQNANDGSSLEVTVGESLIVVEGITDMCQIEGIELTSVCHDNPDRRMWRVRNPNNFRVYVTWDLYGSDKSGGFYLPAAGQGVEKWDGDGVFEYKFFQTANVGGPNTLRLHYGDGQMKTKASCNCVCPVNQSLAVESVCSERNNNFKWTVTNPNDKAVWAQQDGTDRWRKINANSSISFFTNTDTRAFSVKYGNNQSTGPVEMTTGPCVSVNPNNPGDPRGIFYIDNASDKVYTVELVPGDNKKAILIPFFDSPYGDAHMSLNTHGDKLFIVQGGGDNRYGYFDLNTREYHEVGKLNVGAVFQVTFNPYGEMYFAANNLNQIKVMSDPLSGEFESYGAIYVPGKGYINLNGADMAFNSDGSFFVATHAGNKIYKVTGEKGNLQGEEVSTTDGKKATGLAALNSELGDLVFSAREESAMTVLSLESGVFTEYPIEGEITVMGWGDMTSGVFNVNFDGCQVYLADEDTQVIYAINTDMNTGTSTATALFDYPFEGIHIALNLEGDKLYVVSSRDQNRFGYFDFSTFQFTELNDLGGVGKITQLAFSPYGELHFTSNTDNEIYKFTNVENSEFISLGKVRIDGTNNFINIEGSDIAFDQDGTFYLASNNTPDDIYQVSGVANHLLAVPITGNMGGHITGLAIDDEGDLLVSYQNKNYIKHIDTETFEKTNLSLGGDIAQAGWGDMSSSCFNQLEFCDGYASRVVSYNPGTLKTGVGTPPQDRMIADNALGKPQESENVNFVSLGFGGDIVLKLASPVYNYNKNGVYVDNENSINYGEKSMADIVIVETSYGKRQQNCGPDRNKNYPEKMLVYGKQSLDDPEWILLSNPEGECRSSFIDVAPAMAAGLEFVQYLKIEDVSDPQFFPNSADGYDVDGVIICPGEVVAAITGAGRDGMPIANARTLGEDMAFDWDFFNKEPNEAGERLNMINVYPNPIITDEIQLSIDRDWESAGFDILDISGRLLMQGQVGRNAPTIDINGLSNGIYILNISVGTEQESIKIKVRK